MAKFLVNPSTDRIQVIRTTDNPIVKDPWRVVEADNPTDAIRTFLVKPAPAAAPVELRS